MSEERTAKRDADGPDGGAGWRQAVQRHFDPEGELELTTAIVFAIADAANVDPAELKSPTLYEVVDVPSIEETFFGAEEYGESRRGAGRVEFTYEDYRVVVDSDGWIRVFERVSDRHP